jgi:hypothetical protein
VRSQHVLFLLVIAACASIASAQRSDVQGVDPLSVSNSNIASSDRSARAARSAASACRRNPACSMSA